MRTVMLDGDGAAGIAAYERLRAEGATVVVNAPRGSGLAELAARDGTLTTSTNATFVGVFADEIVEAFDPPDG